MKDPITIDFTQYKGRIRTRNGYPARIVAIDKKGGDDNKRDGERYPLVVLIEKIPGYETVYTYTKDGHVCAVLGQHGMDLMPDGDEIVVTVNLHTADAKLMADIFHIYAHAFVDGEMVPCEQVDANQVEPGEVSMQMIFRKKTHGEA